ncbi:MAG: DUF1707 and DUF4190 domain-containing protein [Acidimicrobiales bacterium]|nr:DUF1707 and DUF4190 domain-containing protein [Acidimicrobiales bacterium]MBO0886116.1 DUF1707 and DUF4190 domain-containing protein [Acidimicrobiales bacterium]MBO0894078.1 DUF1707 and DUF4190 domain-containing protein [Acidimicrobiales bacterium]
MAVGPAEATGPSHWVDPAGTSHLRASDADRERAVDLLRAAFVEGRLDNEEYDERVAQAYASRTYGDLTRLIADLPAPPRPVPATVRRPTNAMAIGSLVCGIAQFFTMGLTMIPAIVLGHTARRQMRRSGESGDALALAGLVLGWLGVAIAALAVLGLLVAGAVAHAHAVTGGFQGGPFISQTGPVPGP